MLLPLYFPVTCNPSRAVTLPNIKVLHYIGVPHRVSYPSVCRVGLLHWDIETHFWMTSLLCEQEECAESGRLWGATGVPRSE